MSPMIMLQQPSPFYIHRHALSAPIALIAPSALHFKVTLTFAKPSGADDRLSCTYTSQKVFNRKLYFLTSIRKIPG